jgi:hypothetical protein
MKKLVRFTIVLFILSHCAFGLTTDIFCSNCGERNDINNKFCWNCGDSLGQETEQIYRQQQTGVQFLKSLLHWQSDPMEPSRLFNIPTAEVLQSRDISLMGASAFTMNLSNSLFGTIGVGLGNIAEVEFSSVGLANNIAQGKTSVTTSSFKIKLIPDNFLGWRYCPRVAIAFRSLTDWKDMNSDAAVINANEDFVVENITRIHYNTRFTVLYSVASLPFDRFSLHGGLSLHDIRIKDTNIHYWDSFYADPYEIQKNVYGGFFGISVNTNDQSRLMFEIETAPTWTFDEEIKQVRIDNVLLAIGGVRFYFTNWLSIDTGVWYQNNYDGIADTQIKLGLNLFLPGSRLVQIDPPIQ